MEEYLKLDKLRTLFNIDERIYKLYNILNNSMRIPDDKYYVVLWLCPNMKEVKKCFKYLVEKCVGFEYLSNKNSKIISKDTKNNIMYFYNHFKSRQEKNIVLSIKSVEQGFDGYRISELKFFGLD